MFLQFSFSFRAIGDKAIEETFKPYGPKLGELSIGTEVKKDALLGIASTCPNIILDFGQYDRSHTETFIALGRASSSWMMHQSDMGSEVFSHVGLSCSGSYFLVRSRTTAERIPFFALANRNSLLFARANLWALIGYQAAPLIQACRPACEDFIRPTGTASRRCNQLFSSAKR